MDTLRFLQFSDLHFGSQLGRAHLKLSVQKAALRQKELNRLVKRICDTAVEKKVDLVLVPGDLWDSEIIASDTYHYLIECFNGLQGIPLVITPGNHDYYSKRSFYDAEFLRAKNYLPWPENTIIFTQETFQTVSLPRRSDVQITGCAFQGNMERQNRILASLQPIIQPDQFNLLAFHGSRDDRLPGGSKMLTAPFTPSELMALGYDYTAVGHYHRLDIFKDAQGTPRGAYAGCPFGRGLDEMGSKYVLYGEIQKTEKGFSQVCVTPLSLDSRRILRAQINISPYLHTDSLLEGITQQLSTYQVDKEEAPITADDLIVCYLEGQLTPGFSPDFLRVEEQLAERFFHIQLNVQGVMPGFNYADYDTDSVASFEARFYRYMQERIQAEPDEIERGALTSALKYGLQALKNDKKLDKPYEY